MKPEEKCVSLETARKLKHAGFPQHMERYWETSFSSASLRLAIEVAESYYLVPKPDMWTTGDCKPIYAAPDAQEIGALLPACITKDGVERYLNCDKDCYEDKGKPQVWDWIYQTVDDETQSWFCNNKHENEAESRAECWLYLKENKLI